LQQIGGSGVDLVVGDADFKTNLAQFLAEVYEQQNAGEPVLLDYGFDVKDKTGFELGTDLEFPTGLGPLTVMFGGGIQASSVRTYPLAEGHWVQGAPYLQREAAAPPAIALEIYDVLDELWARMIAGDVYAELWAVIVAKLRDTIFGGNDTRSTVALNERGSQLELRPGGFPAGLDSALCRHWLWEEETPQVRAMSQARQAQLKAYNAALREARESAAGLRYGIGGFFRLEPDGAVFQDSTRLTIAYDESELAGADESALGVFWQDSLGRWTPLPSLRDTVANAVSAWIPAFRTYTLAPRLPQGEFGLQATPDSLAADGVSLATLVSDSLFNNDGTPVTDGALFTVVAARGTLLGEDADPLAPGLQRPVSGARLWFQLQADSLAQPIRIEARSAEGFATGVLELPCYDIALPSAPTLLELVAEHGALRVRWAPVADPDLAAYRVGFDTDGPAPPYDGRANVWGEDSPVTVGLETEALLDGLSSDSLYFVAVCAVDVAGREGPWSSALALQPGLRAVDDLRIERTDAGQRLRWSAVHGAARYRVEASDDPYAAAAWQTLAETTALAWTDPGAPAARVYRVVVIAN
jgi:hypothetical protein